MILHADRVAPEKTAPASPAAVFFAGEKRAIVQKEHNRKGVS